jgi:hypothetical protein
MMTKTPLLLLLLASVASADTYRQHGSICAAKHTSRDLVGVDERGTYNASTTASATVTCAAANRRTRDELHYSDGNWNNPTPSTQDSNVLAVTIFGRDVSDAAPFSCYLFATQSDGFSSWGPTKYTCSQPGGCPDSTSSFVGNASLTWNLDASMRTADHIGVVCNLPATTASGSSYVKAVVVKDAAHTNYMDFTVTQLAY